MNWKKYLDTNALNNAVAEMLDNAGIGEHDGETYEETAKRISDEYPNISAELLKAEERWFELEG